LIVTDAGDTVTLAIGETLTETVALPETAPTVAVIVTIPSLTPVTVPSGDILAMPLLELVHCTVGPVRTFPAPSRAVAVNFIVSFGNIERTLGVTDTLPADVGTTETVAVLLFPPAVAVMVADPTATAVTLPESTVATLVLLLVHTTVRPANWFPWASDATAVNVEREPTTASTWGGSTATLATCCCTVIEATPDFPLTFAAIAV
jgi:hypothetical protein